MSLDVPFMSAFFNFRAQQTSYIVILFSFFLLLVFTLPNLGLTTPGTYNPNARGSDACRGVIVYGSEH